MIPIQYHPNHCFPSPMQPIYTAEGKGEESSLYFIYVQYGTISDCEKI